MKDNLFFLLQSLLQKNKITIDSEELDFQIQSHPSYPSLHAVTGVLDHFDIENTAIKIPVNKEILSQLPISFIAQIKRNNENNLALVLNKGKNYKLIFNNKESETVSETNFLKQFTGILVAVEKDKSKSVNKISTTNFYKPLLAIALVLFTILFFISNPNLSNSIYFILSLIGLGISLLIIQHNLGLSSKIVDTICSQESKTTNCNAVLNSKGATLYKDIKLSDVSFVYFASISIVSLFFSLTNILFNTLYIISLTATPIIIYSVYYQIKISKSWCALCLVIVSVLTLQASFIFITESNFDIQNFETVLIIVFSFIIIASVWLLINSKLKREQEFKILKIKSNRFKRNFDIFNTLLQQSETKNTIIKNTSEIVLGNKNAPLSIIVITNPFCGHCKSVHNLIETILKRHHNELNITIRFNVKTENKESREVLVSNRLLELFQTNGELKCLEAMHDIYNNLDYQTWLTKWKKCISININKYTNVLEEKRNWCLDNGINFTPEILINNKTYPQVYDRSDLSFFIEDLQEASYTNIHTTRL